MLRDASEPRVRRLFTRRSSGSGHSSKVHELERYTRQLCLYFFVGTVGRRGTGERIGHGRRSLGDPRIRNGWV